MTGAFEVEPDDLVAHASHVDSLVDRLQTAVSAADSAMSDHAYGLLCAFLPPIIRPTGEQAKDSISAGVEGVRTLADNVRTTAQSYRDADQGNAEPFERQLSAEPVAAERTVLRGSMPMLGRTTATEPREALRRTEGSE